MTIRWKSKILLIQIEATEGIDPGPTGAANAIQAKNIQISPYEGTDKSRDLEFPALGAQPTLPIDEHAKISFQVEIEPSGVAGTPPAWGPLLRACGVAEVVSAGVSVTYNPVSDGHESAAIHFFIGGTRFVILGARSSAKLMWQVSDNPVIEFTFTGLFTQPTEQARPTPDLSGWKKPRHASTTNTPVCTLNGISMVTRSLSLDLGCKVEPRFLIGASGMLITDKAEQIEMQVQGVPLTTFNPYQLAAAQTDVAVVLTHGLNAGRITTLNVPKAQMQRPAGLTQVQEIVEWPLRMVPQPGPAFDDQWTLTLT